MSAASETSAPHGLTFDSLFNSLAEIAYDWANSDIPPTPDMRIDKYLARTDDLGLDLLDLQFRIENRFGVTISNDDWDFLAGSDRCKSPEDWEARYAALFTFRRLAELIAARLQIGTIEPLTIMGATSRSAGAFRTIESVIHQIASNIEPFAPSTPILARLRGRNLARAWARLRVLSADRIPPLPQGLGQRISRKLQLGFGACLALLVGAVVAYKIWEYFAGAGSGMAVAYLLICTVATGVTGAALLILSFIIEKMSTRYETDRTLLPPHVHTFRDLAELLSADRGGYCAQCGYDLTGLTTPRCPECGRSFEASPPVP